MDVPLARIKDLLQRRKVAQTGAQGVRDVAAMLTHSLADVERRLQQCGIPSR